MKEKLNKMENKSIVSMFFYQVCVLLVVVMTAFVSCQKENSIAPNPMSVAKTDLLKSGEIIADASLGLSGEEMSGAKSANTDVCKDLMAKFNKKIKLIESLSCATDQESIIKRGYAVMEAIKLIQAMIDAGCAIDVAQLTLMVAAAADCDE